MKSSERLRDGMKKQVVGLWIDNSFIDEVEATENELEICKAALDNAKIRLSESVKNEQSLNEQLEKLLRKFKRIPTTIADAYNENVSLREDLILALETCQVLQAGISWFNVDEQNEIMEKLYKKYLVGWDKEDVELGAKLESNETALSELGIAFDDLKFEKDIMEARLIKIQEWSKRQVYSEDIDLDELNEILGNKGGSCPFAGDWKNKEGWFIQENGRLICADFDDYCTICRKDNSNDFVFGIAGNHVKKGEIQTQKV